MKPAGVCVQPRTEGFRVIRIDQTKPEPVGRKPLGGFGVDGDSLILDVHLFRLAVAVHSRVVPGS